MNAMFSNGNLLIFVILLKYMSFFTKSSQLLLLETVEAANFNNYIDSNDSITNDEFFNYQSNNNTDAIDQSLKNNFIAPSDETQNVENSVNKTDYMATLNEFDINYNDDSVAEELPQPAALFDFGIASPQIEESKDEKQVRATLPDMTSSGQNHHQSAELPVFPERSDAVYFIVAIIGGARQWGRILARTLLDIGPPFDSPMGPPLRPLYVDLPENGRFSVKVLTSLCQQSDSMPLAGIVIVGDGQSARAVAMSGNAMNVPVLWAKGGTANINALQREPPTGYQSMLQPSAKEILEAIRALFLQTHWYSFFVLSDVGATIVLAGHDGIVLKADPLLPTILPLPAGNVDVFRQLAQISRSTRGIILLLCDLTAARKIMSEAKRLNMAGGHFIWLWADTSSKTEFFDVHRDDQYIQKTKQQQLSNADVNHHEKFAEYPEAIKQYPMSSSSSGQMDETISRRLGSKLNRKSIDERKETMSRRHHHQKVLKNFGQHQQAPHNLSIASSPPPVERHNPYVIRQKNDQKVNQKSRKPFENHDLNNAASPAGHYVFGLNTNSGENDEIKVIKGKRNFFPPPRQEGPSEFDEADGDVSDVIDYIENSYEESAEYFLKYRQQQQNGANNYHRQDDDVNYLPGSLQYRNEELVNNNYSEYNEDYNEESDNNNESYMKNNKTDSITNGNHGLKPKRTSQFYSKNSTTSSHVLFHHFKDFPVGLLALRPIRIPVDRNFVRSTVRLFASTWSEVDRDANQKDQLRNRVQNNNDPENWWNRPRPSENTQQERITISKNHRGPIDDRSQRFRRRRRRIRRESSNVFFESSTSHVNQVNINTKLENKSEKNHSSSISDSNRISYNDIKNSTNRSANSKRDTSSYNQNLSGLSNRFIKSNNKSNTTASRSILMKPLKGNQSKTKRYNTWWSSSHLSSSASYRHENLRDRINHHHNPYQKFPYPVLSSIATASPTTTDGAPPQYRGGCFGIANGADIRKAEIFAKALKEATKLSLSGQKLPNGRFEKSLTTNFELLNLVPDVDVKGKLYAKDNHYQMNGKSSSNSRGSIGDEDEVPTKWRRVGLISGTTVQLDTIVWPGGDIVVTGLSATSKTIFRIVTALAPPFVMESDLDEDGMCLRGLPCHRLAANGSHNLTLMFNGIETRERLEEDTVEHGMKTPTLDESRLYDHSMYETKCCYGLSMDLLDNIATELEFAFHLYIGSDGVFGSKFHQFEELILEKSNHQYKYGSHYYPKEQYRVQHREDEKQYDVSGAIFERKSNLNSNKNGGAKHHRRRRSMLDHDDNSEKMQEDDVNEEANVNSNTNSDFHYRGERSKALWNGVVGDLISGSADMSFAPLSVSRARAEAIDFSTPYFHSGVSLLASPQSKSEIPLLAFLLPFSPELWIAIFTSLNVTAIAVAIYEWLSPFGLNPWGRQRSKNFSMSSALWVMWGLLCGHLVAFKAPKSWPNKFLINVWGGFSVIFIASYTANIAALIAGLFFHNASNRYDVSLLTQRVGAPIATAAESYVQKNDRHLWEHMKKYTLKNIEDGIRGLKNGSLDLLMGDSPILDYYRATDHGCNLQRIGDTFVEDAYAVGMTKGFPLKDSISALITKYSSNGYLDILTEKWYGGLPCFKLDIDIVQPRPLGVEAVAGVFLLLGLGVILGILILIFEHLFYKYTLPILRHKPKGTVWKSRNIMFFSQKLYRFINCVELVSPHHAARELLVNLRQGQIASLFQKSIKRKEDEQRRRRKSKAQFFEMIQEIRRVQQAERANPPKLEVVDEADTISEHRQGGRPQQTTALKPKSSPIPRLFVNRREKDSRSSLNSSTLNVRRFSTDSILSERLDTIGRRLSRDLTNSPPDFGRRFELSGKNNMNRFDTISVGKFSSVPQTEKFLSSLDSSKFDTYSGKEIERQSISVKKYQDRRTSLNSEMFAKRDQDNSRADDKSPLPVLKEGLVHPICEEDSSKVHKELCSKYSDDDDDNDYRKIQRHDICTQQPPGSILQKTRKTQRSSTTISQHHQRNRSLDGLDPKTRPPMPSPRGRTHRSNDTLDVVAENFLHTASVSPRSQLKQISLQRLSRDDLLKLSESTQSEIHDYLSKSNVMPPPVIVDQKVKPP